MKTTSIESHDTKDKESDYQKILWALGKTRTPKTYRQISKMLRWEAVRSARRMAELVRIGKVETTGVVICPIGGKKCHVYSLVENVEII